MSDRFNIFKTFSSMALPHFMLDHLHRFFESGEMKGVAQEIRGLKTVPRMLSLPSTGCMMCFER